MLRMQEMAFPCFKFQNFLGEYTPRLPIHAWYIGHTRGLQSLLSPSNILSHRKVPFQKMPPHGKILKKGPGDEKAYFPFIRQEIIPVPFDESLNERVELFKNLLYRERKRKLFFWTRRPNCSN